MYLTYFIIVSVSLLSHFLAHLLREVAKSFTLGFAVP